MAEFHRGLVFVGGLSGAFGVALSAASAHSGGGNIAIAASFLLMHAPAFLALSVLSSGTARVGGAILACGLALFCGDLLARQFLGNPLFPYAAPTGGLLLIGGWLVVAASAMVPRSR